MITFKDCCVERTEILNELLRKDFAIYDNWLNFLVNLLPNEQGEEKIENPILAAFLTEAIDCLDGVSVLHQQSCINAAYPLLRKLMELNFQVKFMLKSDTENKALAFEAYYVSRKTKGNDHAQNIYLQSEKYQAYKTEADRVFNDENYHGYPEWYEIYDRVEKQPLTKQKKNNLITGMKKICEQIGDKDIYDKIYNHISKNVHGFLARDRIKLDSINKKNYIGEYREPSGFSYQTRCCNLIAAEIYREFCKHYKKVPNMDFIKCQFELTDNLCESEKKYNLLR